MATNVAIKHRAIATDHTRALSFWHVYMRNPDNAPTQADFMATGGTSDAWEIYARELGVNLHRARDNSGLSQERVAHAAGISTFTYRKLEKGESNPGTSANPRLRTLIALSEVLDLELHELLPVRKPAIATGR